MLVNMFGAAAAAQLIVLLVSLELQPLEAFSGLAGDQVTGNAGAASRSPLACKGNNCFLFWRQELKTKNLY